MAERMRRTQILFPETEYRRLRRVAQEQGRSIGSLVREAVERYYLEPSRARAIEAAKRIGEMNLPIPVQDWEEIEEELARIRAKGCDGEEP